jgi:hypothetical protein
MHEAQLVERAQLVVGLPPALRTGAGMTDERQPHDGLVIGRLAPQGDDRGEPTDNAASTVRVAA